jgi:hypothetical protein
MRWISPIACSSSSANAAAAVALRSAYQRAASSASVTASSRRSSVRVTSGRLVDASPCFGPRDGLRSANVELIKPPSDLDRPRLFSVVVDVVIQTLNQFPGKGRAGFGRQLQRLFEQLLGIHAQEYHAALPIGTRQGIHDDELITLLVVPYYPLALVHYSPAAVAADVY